MARRSEFEGRMLSILDPVLDRHPLSRGRTLMSALASPDARRPARRLQPYRAEAPCQTIAPVHEATNPWLSTSFPSRSRCSFHAVPAQPTTEHQRGHAHEARSRTFSGRGKDAGGGQASLQRKGSELVTSSSNTASCDIDAARRRTVEARHTFTPTTTMGRRSSSSSVPRATVAALRRMHRGTLKYNANEDDIIDMSQPARTRLFRAAHGPPTIASSRVDRTDNGIVQQLSLQRQQRGLRRRAHAAGSLRYSTDRAEEARLNVEPRVAKLAGRGWREPRPHRDRRHAGSGAKRSHYEALLDEGHAHRRGSDRIVQRRARTHQLERLRAILRGRRLACVTSAGRPRRA